MAVIFVFPRRCIPDLLVGSMVAVVVVDVTVVEVVVDMVAVDMEVMGATVAVDPGIALEIATGDDLGLVPVVVIGEGDLSGLHPTLDPDLGLLDGIGKGQGGTTDLDHLLRTGGPRADLRIGLGPKVLVDRRIVPDLKAEVDRRIGQGPKVLVAQRIGPGPKAEVNLRIDLDQRVAQNQRIRGQSLRAAQRTALGLRVPVEADQRVIPRAVPDLEVTLAPNPSLLNEHPGTPVVNQRVDPRVAVPPLEGRVGLLQEDDPGQGDGPAHGTRHQGTSEE